MFSVARPGTSYPPPPESTQQKDNVPTDITGQQHLGGGMSNAPGMSGPALTSGQEMSSITGQGNQSNNDDDFSDFQEAKPSIPNQFPSSTGWSIQAGNQVPPGNPIPPRQQIGNNSASTLPNQQFSGNQQMPGHQQFHGSQELPRSWLSGNLPFNSNQSPGNQVGNLPFQENQAIKGNQYFPSQSGHNIPVSTWPNQSGAGTVTSGGFVQNSPGLNQFSNNSQSFGLGTVGPSVGHSQRERADSQSSVSSVSSSGMASERPVKVSGQFAPMDSQEPGKMTSMQFVGQQGSPGQVVAASDEDTNAEGIFL